MVINPDYIGREGRSIPISTYVEFPVYEMIRLVADLEEMSMASWVRRALVERLIDLGFTPEGVSVE